MPLSSESGARVLPPGITEKVGGWRLSSQQHQHQARCTRSLLPAKTAVCCLGALIDMPVCVSHPQEAKSLAKHFEDPKFRELFEEYAKEISDPKVRACATVLS